MKPHPISIFASAAFALSAVVIAPGAAAATAEDAASPAATTTPAVATLPGEPTTPVPGSAATGPDIASAQWTDIKDCTYDMRDQFFTGLKRLEAKVDRQIGALTAKRAVMEGTAETKDWDFAMEVMKSARSYLKSMRAELLQATAETWIQQREKVGEAWVRTQNAHDKVEASTTR